jgi:hypothetical protein
MRLAGRLRTASVGAALSMKVEDYYTEVRKAWLGLDQRGRNGMQGWAVKMELAERITRGTLQFF